MKRNKGITLIALVITIIVLLILAGVTISMLSGENGILRKAAEAKTKTEEKSLEERIKIAAIGALDDKTLKINKEKLKEELRLGDEDIVEAGDNGYEVKVDGKTTYVSDDGKEIGELKEIDIILDEYFKSKNLPYKCRYGFVTGLDIYNTNETSNLKMVLNELGYNIYNEGNTSEVQINDDSDLTTGMAITKDGNMVARIVVFGMVAQEDIDTCDITVTTHNNILKYINGDKDFKDYQIKAMDINHNGRIEKDDAQEVLNFLADMESKIDNQSYYVSKAE